jgi:hypothetical protein
MPISEVQKLELSYENNRGNARVTREYYNYGSHVQEVETEELFNYTTEEWETSRQYTRRYELADDGETLLGDGSGWSGANKNWEEWFEQRHQERTELRFPYDF